MICFYFLDEISVVVKAGRKGVLRRSCGFSQKSQSTRRTPTMPRVHVKCVDIQFKLRPVEMAEPFLQPHSPVRRRPALGRVGIWVGSYMRREGSELGI